MEHNHNHHNHSHQHHSHDETTKGLLIAFFMNFSFVIIEIVTGVLSGSITLLSDAVHDFGDSTSIVIALIFNKFSKKEKCDRHPFGHKRFNLLGALITSLILILGSIGVLYFAIIRLFNPVTINSTIMIYIAIFGVVVNGIPVLKLSQSKDVLSRSIMLHLLEDFLGYIGVLVSGTLIALTGIYQIDSITSIIISGFILFNASKNLILIFNQILITTPTSVDADEVKAKVEEITNITIESLYVWEYDTDYNILNITTTTNFDTNILIEPLEQFNIEEIYLTNKLDIEKPKA